MPKSTNGVYQQVSSPKPENCGVGKGVSYPQKAARPGMGGNTQKPGYPKGSMSHPRSHDGRGNSTYK